MENGKISIRNLTLFTARELQKQHFDVEDKLLVKPNELLQLFFD